MRGSARDNSFSKWLGSVRRRIRLRRAARTTLIALVGWGIAAIGLLGLARMVPLGWQDVAVLAGAMAAAVAGALMGLLRRLPVRLAARAVDAELRGDDRIATAEELLRRSIDGSLAALQTERAAAWATRIRRAEAAPFRVSIGRVVVLLALGTAVAALMMLPNPKDAVVAKRKAEAAALQREAINLRKLARKVEESKTEPKADQALARELETLAARLEDSKSLDQGLAEIARTEGKLAELQRDDHLLSKTLKAGADRAVANKPLASGAKGDLAGQLEQLSKLSAQLAESERREAASRLSSLAESFAVSDPNLSAALAEAARELASGVEGGALERASEQARATESAIAAGNAIDAARASVAQSRERLATAGREGTSSSESDGGQSNNDPGSQDGEGTGSPNGSTRSGSEGGEGPGSRNGSSGSGSQGGDGGPGGGAGGREGGSGESSVRESEIYDPILGGALGDELRLTGPLTSSEGRILSDTSKGPRSDGTIRIPYRLVYGQWSARAARNVDLTPIPASLRSFVREYFASLEPRR